MKKAKINDPDITENMNNSKKKTSIDINLNVRIFHFTIKALEKQLSKMTEIEKEKLNESTLHGEKSNLRMIEKYGREAGKHMNSQF